MDSDISQGAKATLAYLLWQSVEDVEVQQNGCGALRGMAFDSCVYGVSGRDHKRRCQEGQHLHPATAACELNGSFRQIGSPAAVEQRELDKDASHLTVLSDESFDHGVSWGESPAKKPSTHAHHGCKSVRAATLHLFSVTRRYRDQQ